MELSLAEGMEGGTGRAKAKARLIRGASKALIGQRTSKKR